MEYFVLQAKIKLNKGDNPYHIPRLKDALGNLLDIGGMTPATPASIESGVLEWIIPNNQSNQSHISRHYAKSHIILKAGEERTFESNIGPMEGMPEPLAASNSNPLSNNTPPPPKVVKPVKVKKLGPQEIKKLKSEISEKLTALGTEIPTKATLPELEALFAEASNKK